MVNGRYGATFRQIDTLMRFGTVANLTDGQLLDRFLTRSESGEAAFEALVSRHGGMVMAVCRQVLGSSDGADDAFQATFLVLVRQAGSIHKKDSLGPWLHGVARRVSLRARRDAARRKERERGVFRVVRSEPPDEVMAATLHDEIARLPEKYRTPIVLCDLEGQSHAEAAKRLAWPIGTVSSRLSRARALLKSRIARRGLALSSAGLAATLSSGCAPTPVSAIVVAKAVKVASTQLAGGQIAASLKALAASWATAPSSAVMKMAAGLVASVGLGWTGLVSQGRIADRPVAPPAMTLAHAVEPWIPGTPPSVARRRLLDDERQIVSVALAPDGVTLASGSLDASVTLWDLETGLEKSTMIGHGGAVRSLSFTRDGRTLASTSEDLTLKLWDVASGMTKLTVTWLEPNQAPAFDLGPESCDSGRGAPGRDRCADGPVRDGDPTGA